MFYACAASAAGVVLEDELKCLTFICHSDAVNVVVEYLILEWAYLNNYILRES